MTAVTYTAARSLSPGHSAGIDYNIRLRCIAADYAKDEKKTETKSLSGRASQTIVLRRLKKWSITTAALQGSELAAIREYLESISEGETFSFDEYGMIGAPHEPIDAVLDGSYRESRVIKQGNGGQNDYFRFSFTIRER